MMVRAGCDRSIGLMAVTAGRSYRRRSFVCVGVVGVLSVVVAACSPGSTTSASNAVTVPGSGIGSTTSAAALPAAIGKGEGQLDLIAFDGYAESGLNDPEQDWVHPFTKESGCKLNVKVEKTSDDMASLMHTGDYDGVSAPGEVSLGLILSGDVAPVNEKLLANYADVAPFLKMTSYNSYRGQLYGQPQGWGANMLMFNPAIVKPAPDSWGAVFDPKSPYSGKIVAYGSPIYIADAALYLMKTQPALKITNPFALDRAQFDAAIAVLTRQRSIIGDYWTSYADMPAAFASGSLVMGAAWQVIADVINAKGVVHVDTVVPKEGATAWADTWLISSKAKHPNCMYEWMNWISRPEIQAQMALWNGEAPANVKACAVSTKAKSLCGTYHADDQAFASQLWFATTTPTTDCLDGRGHICIGYDDWAKAWAPIKN